jgi:hypothetical protein
MVAGSLDEALQMVQDDKELADTVESIFVIGGDQMYPDLGISDDYLPQISRSTQTPRLSKDLLHIAA